MTRPDTYLIYGQTNSGKTTELGRMAKWEFDQTGGISRLVSADSGWESIEPDLIRSPENPGGIIEAWNIQGLVYDPWGTLIAVAEGSWPSGVKQTDRGPRLELAKPSRDAEGYILGSGGRRVTQYFWEGLSTISNLVMRDHIRSGRAVGQEQVGKFASEVLIDGQIQTRNLSKAAPSHYGHVQDFVLLDLVPRTAQLPVSRVVWTAHQSKGEDKLTGKPVLGPLSIGSAAAARTAEKFGFTFHLALTRGKDGSLEHKAWFINHPDEMIQTMLWPTKLSLPLSARAKLAQVWPGGFVPLGYQAGMDRFLEYKAGLKAQIQPEIGQLIATQSTEAQSGR